MKTFEKLLLNEMAFKSNAKYYHGSSQKGGEGILSTGMIRPGNTEIKRGKSATPIIERTYLTPSIRYATIYAIGGNFIGNESYPDTRELEREGKYCYVFVVNKLDGKDVIIDEDAVGEVLHYSMQKLRNPDKYKNYEYDEWSESDYIGKWLENSDALLSSFANKCHYILTPLQFEKVRRYDDILHLIIAGKKITKVLDPYYVDLLMKAGCPFSVKGEIKFDEAWKLDRTLNYRLKRDASNFFQVAERIR